MSGTDEGVEATLGLWSDRLPYIPMVACGGSLLVSLSLRAVEPKSSRSVTERIFFGGVVQSSRDRDGYRCAVGRAGQGKDGHGALGNVCVRETGWRVEGKEEKSRETV